MTTLTLVSPAMNVEPAHIKEPHAALRFMLAGNAYVTFRSHFTDIHFTYHIEANKRPSTGGGRSASHFVSVLTAPDHYDYLGVIFDGRFYSHGHRSRITASAKSALAFPWVWKRLTDGRVPETCDVYHEGKCGRCGRRLTHPESIETGLGPECAKKEGT